MPALQFVSKKETQMGSKAIESLRWFDGYSSVIGKRCRFVADGISTLIANCRFLVLSLIEAEASCAVQCDVLAALFPSTKLGCFHLSVLF